MQKQEKSQNGKNFFNLLIRLILLGAIVFGATQFFIPTADMNTKVLITFSVVIIYSLLDVIRMMFLATKSRMCEIIC